MYERRKLYRSRAFRETLKRKRRPTDGLSTNAADGLRTYGRVFVVVPDAFFRDAPAERE